MKSFKKRLLYTSLEVIKITVLIILQLMWGTQESNAELEKLQNSIELENTYVESDDGYVKASHVHFTKSFRHYELKTKSGLNLTAADEHLIYTDYNNYTTVNELKAGDSILTRHGLDEIVSIENKTVSTPMFDLTVESERHAYYTNDIVSHNTISAAIFLAWFALFHYDKNSLVVANKGKTVKEIIGKTKSVIQHLPFFLKPGIMVNNKTSMAFDNGSRIVGETASATPAIGFTIHTIYADEFGHINPNIVDSYYKSIYPTLSASKDGKMIITSTANGRNKFFEIYNDAVNEESQFKPIRIDWWQVPGRDEEWRKNEIANLGSVEAFRQEFGNSFDITNQSLFSGSHLKRMKKTISSYKFEQFDVLDAWGIDYENLEWYKNFNVESLSDKRKFFVVGIDLSEGLGGNSDNTVFNIFQLMPMLSRHIQYLPSPTHIKDLFALKQVGMFTSNTISIKEAAKFLYLLTYEISTPDNMRMAIEYNNYGRELIGHLPIVCENINDFGIESVLHFYHQINSNVRKAGLRLNRGNKSKYVVNVRKNFEQGRLHFTHNDVFKEGQEFGKSRGKWESQRGKDDVIMSTVQANSVFETLAFEEFVELYFDYLPMEKQQEILNKIEDSPNTTSNMIDNETDMYDVLNDALGNSRRMDNDIDLSFM